MTYRSFSLKKGFTIIELLVVIAIIILLNGIILNNFASSRAKARDAKRVSDLGQIQLALALYFDRCKAYPVALATDTSTNCVVSSGTVNLGTYISQIPAPSTPTNGLSQYGYAYMTDSSGNRSDFVLHIQLEGTSDAVRSSLATMPAAPSGGAWTYIPTPFTCSNSAGSIEYCIGSK